MTNFKAMEYEINNNRLNFLKLKWKYEQIRL